MFVFRGYATQIATLETSKASQSAELTGIITGLQQQLVELQREKSRLDEQTRLDHASIVRLRAQVDEYSHQQQHQQPPPQAQPPQAPQVSTPPPPPPQQPQFSQPPVSAPTPTPTAAMAVEDARRIKDLSQVGYFQSGVNDSTASDTFFLLTYPIDTSYQQTLSGCLLTHPINKFFQRTLSIQVNSFLLAFANERAFQEDLRRPLVKVSHTPSTYPVNKFCQHSLLTYSIDILC